MALELGLEQAIHERWAATGALTALVPAARVFTGAAVNQPATPYVVWMRVNTAPHARTSSGRQVDRTRMRCEIRTEQLAVAKQVAQAIFDAYNRAAFALVSGSCLTMQHVAHEESLAPEGWWRVATEFDVLHEGF
ncbi:MAG: DUF3168 domain-containing protein [Planctomycetia bacterium]|nr:DUF3168 domain-containing protein [Planctomycetia bacterium]